MCVARHLVMICCESGDARAYSHCWGFGRVSIASAFKHPVPSIFEDHTAGGWNCSGKIETVEI